jgi:hypothetical protein
MNKIVISLLIGCLLISCKNKKLDSTKAYFSVVDYLSGEVKKTDTLPLRFKKITLIDSRTDTSLITKKEFHNYADEFLNLPDIASANNMDDYTETNDFDEILNNVLLIYSAKEPNSEVRNETIMMQPDEQGNTHVKTIIVTTVKNEDGKTVEKNMTWHIDKRFQIVTKTSQQGQPEKINTIIVTWE